jgi:hypothetical protein
VIKIQTTNPLTGQVATEVHNEAVVAYQVDAQGKPLGYVAPGLGVQVPPAPEGEGWAWSFGRQGWVPPLPDPKRLVQQEIEALERTQLMPRAARECMLMSMQAQFTPEALAGTPGYMAIKAADDSVKALRGAINGHR